MKNFHYFVFILFSSFLYSCNSSKPIFGVYRSNFARNCFFVEKLILKKDSTFEYQVTGDVIHKRGKEFYKITYRKLNLIYQFDPIDTTGTAYLTSLGFPVEDDRKSWIASFPRLFFIRNGKLLSTDINGKIIRRARIKSLYQKPLKKYYLKQIDSIIGNL